MDLLKHQLNRMLPDDVRINCVREAPPRREKPWHAIACSTGKRYSYRMTRRAHESRDPWRGCIGPTCVTRTWTLRCCQMHSKGAGAASTSERPRTTRLHKTPWRWTRFARFGPSRPKVLATTVQIGWTGRCTAWSATSSARVWPAARARLELDDDLDELASGRQTRRDNPTSPRPRAYCASRRWHHDDVMRCVYYCAGGPPEKIRRRARSPPRGAAPAARAAPQRCSRRWPPAARAARAPPRIELARGARSRA